MPVECSSKKNIELKEDVTMMISNSNKRNICMVLLTILFVYSLSSILLLILLVNNTVSNATVGKVDIRAQDVSKVLENVKTISKCQVSSLGITSRFFKHSFDRKNIIIPFLIVAFVFVNPFYSGYAWGLSEFRHVITISYIQKSDGKK